VALLEWAEYGVKGDKMRRSRITVLVLVVLAALVAPASRPAAASAGPDDQLRDSVSVTGTGDVFGEPDTLTADFAVEADASTVDQALDRANTATTRMRDALVRAGVVKADLQTSNVGISPKRDDHNDITGYTVSQGLTATIRDLPRAGALMSAAIAAGGDAARLNGVSFSISDQAALLVEARKKAFADARAKAELYARAAGRSLGRVVKVSEETGGYRGPFGQHDMAAADSAVPIEPGRQRLTATVAVEWALNPSPAGVRTRAGRLP
jgi:uncharacterized protein YggE